MKLIIKILPGFFLTITISAIAIFLNHITNDLLHLETLTFAIVLGIICSSIFGKIPKTQEGIKFSLKRLLKLGIILLGFKINLVTILELGPKILISVIIYVLMILTMSYFLGRILKINNKLAILIGVGSGICGASAIVAMTPCIKARDDDSLVAIAIISILGAIGVLIYSFYINTFSGLTDIQYGFWSGLTLHGVAHAVAAAFAKGDVSGEIGTLVKMARVLMLLPVSLILSKAFHEKHADKKTLAFPIYIIWFIFACLINSTGFIPNVLSKLLTKASSYLILISMTAMGLSVNLKSLLAKSKSALLIGVVLFGFMSLVSLFFILRFV